MIPYIGVAYTRGGGYSIFKDGDTPDELSVVFLDGSRPGVVLMGIVTEFDQLQDAMKRVTAEVPALGKLWAVLLEPADNSESMGSFPDQSAGPQQRHPVWVFFHLQLVDRALMHVCTHDRFEFWALSSILECRDDIRIQQTID